MINLKIMTPDQGVCFEKDVLYVDIKTATGHIGLQKNITPMVAAIENGHCRIKLNDNNVNDIEVVLCKGTLYVDKSGIKVFTSAFCFLKDFNKQKIIDQISLLDDKLSKIDSKHKDYIDLQNEYLINKNLLEAFEKN